MNEAEKRKLFDTWWQMEGRFLDPDECDVSWFDKRQELAWYAFDAAIAYAKRERQVGAGERKTT